LSAVANDAQAPRRELWIALTLARQNESFHLFYAQAGDIDGYLMQILTDFSWRDN
jgi:hypothetical protein